MMKRMLRSCVDLIDVVVDCENRRGHSLMMKIEGE